MQKREIHETHSNNMFSQSRYVPIQYIQLGYTTSYVKIHAHLTKISLHKCFYLFLLSWALHLSHVKLFFI